MNSLTIAPRFNGPPGSANGGYAAGLLADAAPWEGPTTVRLQQPPPLAIPLSLDVGTEEVLLTLDGETIARARPGDLAHAMTWEPVTVEAAEEAEWRYRGLHDHPFPSCFVCGPDRAVGDGLRIFAGEVAPDLVAGRWHTHGPMSVPITWAALDCTSAWSCDLAGRPMVLGEMTARIDELPTPETTYVVMGRHLHTEGRKTWTASALLSAEGEVLGQAEHLWISITL